MTTTTNMVARLIAFAKRHDVADAWAIDETTIAVAINATRFHDDGRRSPTIIIETANTIGQLWEILGY